MKTDLLKHFTKYEVAEMMQDIFKCGNEMTMPLMNKLYTICNFKIPTFDQHELDQLRKALQNKQLATRLGELIL